MDYRQSLDFLYGLQRFGIKLGLENIRALLARLDHPERSFPVLHVAGTNGKGSVSACLAEILQQAGYRVGLYTSPHLHDFTERIRVNGRAIDEREVARLTAWIRQRCTGIPATFFEFTTALALHHFRREEIDFAVLEVGMGGRLDATNAVSPRLCVLTPICTDHAEHLGEDLAAIAAEKGGIIKPGVPVVIGPQPPAALAVLQHIARERRAPTFLFGTDFQPLPRGAAFDFSGPGLHLTDLQPGLPGQHQQQNLATALCAAALLRQQGVLIGEPALRRGVERVRWPGRLEWWGTERKILLDGAHNGGGARVLAAYLQSLPRLRGVHWVAGLKGDKQVAEILSPLLPFARALYCTRPPVETAVAPEELAARGAQAGVNSTLYPSPATALQAALAARRSGEIVLVAGSLFLVAAAREILLTQERDRS